MVEVSGKDIKNMIKFLCLFDDILQDIVDEGKINWAKKKTIVSIQASIDKFKRKLEDKKNV